MGSIAPPPGRVLELSIAIAAWARTAGAGSAGRFAIVARCARNYWTRWYGKRSRVYLKTDTSSKTNLSAGSRRRAMPIPHSAGRKHFAAIGAAPEKHRASPHGLSGEPSLT